MDSILKSDIDKTFGRVLRDFRLRKHLTQDELSEKIGISLKYISRIENGNSGVKTQTLIKYMNVLGISPNLLYTEFIDNSSVKLQLELSEKISNLSDEKLMFLNSIIDLIKTLN